MKLYFSPGACSLSPHIVAREAGIPVELVKTDLATKLTASGGDFRRISSKAYVPALELESGVVLTEGPAIVQYLADQKPESGLAPAAGTLERYQLQAWLNFISTELHKSFSPLFNRAASPEARAEASERLAQRLGWFAADLGDKSSLMGEGFTVADAYAFTVLRWTRFVGIDLNRWPNLVTYFERIGQRPAVRAAMDAEGLKG